MYRIKFKPQFTFENYEAQQGSGAELVFGGWGSVPSVCWTMRMGYQSVPSVCQTDCLGGLVGLIKCCFGRVINVQDWHLVRRGSNPSQVISLRFYHTLIFWGASRKVGYEHNSC